MLRCTDLWSSSMSIPFRTYSSYTRLQRSALLHRASAYSVGVMFDSCVNCINLAPISAISRLWRKFPGDSWLLRCSWSTLSPCRGCTTLMLAPLQSLGLLLPALTWSRVVYIFRHLCGLHSYLRQVWTSIWTLIFDIGCMSWKYTSSFVFVIDLQT